MTLFKGCTLRSLDTITLTADFRLRKIYTMRHPLLQSHLHEEGTWAYYDEGVFQDEEMPPRLMEYPHFLLHLNKVITVDFITRSSIVDSALSAIIETTPPKAGKSTKVLPNHSMPPPIQSSLPPPPPSLPPARRDHTKERPKELWPRGLPKDYLTDIDSESFDPSLHPTKQNRRDEEVSSSYQSAVNSKPKPTGPRVYGQNPWEDEPKLKGGKQKGSLPQNFYNVPERLQQQQPQQRRRPSREMFPPIGRPAAGMVDVDLEEAIEETKEDERTLVEQLKDSKVSVGAIMSVPEESKDNARQAKQRTIINNENLVKQLLNKERTHTPPFKVDPKPRRAARETKEDPPPVPPKGKEGIKTIRGLGPNNERLELMYDPILKCYYDPRNNAYYQMRE
eukprot:TRINITY_DN12372_c0_g1_i3.p1 TRINITY_DN12372_c0_g1~~TRINITY_DN12372_c0_g1_i3.p1  ORF type:complete len:393 (-),score=65.88 TRINITY_DN12372_c0_g1_i3:92-1270(-)